MATVGALLAVAGVFVAAAGALVALVGVLVAAAGAPVASPARWLIALKGEPRCRRVRTGGSSGRGAGQTSAVSTGAQRLNRGCAAATAETSTRRTKFY